MADFDFTQTGQEIQDILNGAAMQTDLTEEENRAKAAEQKLQGNIDDINAVIPNGASHNNKLVTHDDMESEVGDLQQADSTLQGNIDAEELRAKAAEEANADAIDGIESMIPAEASSENKLADKNFVTSSIATSTAQYRGSFNQVSDLHLTLEATTDDVAAALEGAIDTADNNDYCFVQVPDSESEPTNIAHIDRYKFNGTAWAYEYTLNNSGFTAAQWEAINSSITSGLVGKLSDLPTNAELITLLAGKQNTLTFDVAPTLGSNNPVTSGGVKTAINDEKERAQAAEGTNADNIAQVISMIPSEASANNKLAAKDYVDAADSSMQTAIEGILALIPQAATALNQLADKAFVNSSIATNTGTFKGTYNVVSDLQLFYNATHAQIAIMLASTIEAADNNDYCYVQVPNSNEDPTSINHTDRYKFNGTSWAYEYTLNNSGFTADQWGAINSGITQALVTSLTNLLTNLVPSTASGENKLTDQAYVIAAIVAAIPACKGQFTTLADLEAVASPKAGDFGIVRTSGTDGYPVFSFYQYKDGAWATFFVLDNYYQLNKPATNNLLLATFDNGMGKYEIPKHIVNIGTELEPIYQNQLYQFDFYDTDNQPRTNTIFVIKYDFTLTQDITIPANCIMEFDGGSITGEYTITCDKTRIAGYGGFDKSITLAGTIEGDIIEFDWWKNEKVSKADYNTFVANGYLTGAIPTISDTNRTILTKHHLLGMIKFGKGIYPFDATMNLGNVRICADCEFDTLLWAPQSDLIYLSGGLNGIIKGLYIEANGNVIKCYSTTTYGLHRYEIRDSTLISYTDHCVIRPDGSDNKSVPYGWLFENVKIYAGPEKSAVYGMSSNSMTYHNVVDAHALFNQVNSNKRGLMLAMFYNSNIQCFDNSNMTYAGWKYFYYADKNNIWYCKVYNCTFEGGDDEHNLIANIVKITTSITGIQLSLHDITLISNNFDIAPIYIGAGIQGGYIDAPQIDTAFFGNGDPKNLANYGSTIYYITGGLDVGGTRRRVGRLYPTKNYSTVKNVLKSVPVSDLQYMGVPQSIINIFTEEEYTGNIYMVEVGNAFDIFNRGASTARPTGIGSGANGTLIMNQDEGFKYFDTTLGKPIYAKAIAPDGTVTWVDATGATV